MPGNQILLKLATFWKRGTFGRGLLNILVLSASDFPCLKSLKKFFRHFVNPGEVNSE